MLRLTNGYNSHTTLISNYLLVLIFEMFKNYLFLKYIDGIGKVLLILWWYLKCIFFENTTIDNRIFRNWENLETRCNRALGKLWFNKRNKRKMYRSRRERKPNVRPGKNVGYPYTAFHHCSHFRDGNSNITFRLHLTAS